MTGQSQSLRLQSGSPGVGETLRQMAVGLLMADLAGLALVQVVQSPPGPVGMTRAYLARYLPHVIGLLSGFFYFISGCAEELSRKVREYMHSLSLRKRRSIAVGIIGIALILFSGLFHIYGYGWGENLLLAFGGVMVGVPVVAWVDAELKKELPTDQSTSDLCAVRSRTNRADWGEDFLEPGTDLGQNKGASPHEKRAGGSSRTRGTRK